MRGPQETGQPRRTAPRHSGSEMIGMIWDAALDASVGPGRQDFLSTAIGEVRRAIEGRPDAE